MGEYVTDTHSLLWHFGGDTRLSGTAKQIFLAADQGEAIILIPTMCLVETVYLVEGGKVPERTYVRLIELVRPMEYGSYRVVPLTMEVALALRHVPRPKIPELPDRVIAATALERGFPLITKDEALRGWDGITTLW